MTASAPLRPLAEGAPRVDRRGALTLAAGALAAVLAGRPARGQTFWHELTDDDGAPLPNQRAPSTLDPFGLPGVLWMGPPSPDVTLFEFYDYNCPVCRRAAPALEALVRETPGLRLGLVQNPIFGAGSEAAAGALLATLRLSGPRAAYTLHERLFAGRGPVTAASVEAAASALGHDRAAREGAEVAADAGRALAAQRALASGLGFDVTPAFVLQGVALFGWPGPQTLRRLVANAKRCDALVCEEK